MLKPDMVRFCSVASFREGEGTLIVFRGRNRGASGACPVAAKADWYPIRFVTISRRSVGAVKSQLHKKIFNR